MNEASEIKNGNEGQEKIGSASINQSNELYLIEDEDLKKLIKHHSGLKEEIKETDQLINSRLEIQTIEKFDEILNKMSKLEFVSPENADEFISKQSKQLNGGMIGNPKLFLDAKKCIYYYNKLCNFKIKEEQLEEMIKKLVIAEAEIDAKKQDEFTKIKIRIINAVLSNFKIKTTGDFYRFVDKVIGLEQVEKTTEKTQEQNDNLLDNKNKEAQADNFNTRKVHCYKSVLKNFNINTMDQFDEILNQMIQLGFKTIQEAKEKSEKLGEVKTEEELKYCLNAKKFCYYEIALNDFFNLNFLKLNDEYVNLFDNPDLDLHNHESKFCKFSSLTFSQLESMIDINNDYKLILDNPDSCSGFWKVIINLYNPKVRNFVIQQFRPLIVLRNNVGLTYIRKMMVWFCYLLVSETILLFLSNPDRYEFFLQFHLMLEKNLPDEDKQLFYDYLKSCQEALQNRKEYYNWFIENNFSLFTRREKHLIGIIIFGIIASAAVLTINLLEIYAATWFFWLGIVGVVLTVAVGIRLFFCLRKNLNNLRKLDSDLQQEGKTIQDKIAEIDRAIDVYDLNKIRDFKDPELEKIPTIEIYKNKIINNNEINTNKQNDNPKLGPIDQEETIDNN